MCARSPRRPFQAMEAASSWTTTPDRAASVPDTRNPAVKVSQCPHTQARGDAPSPGSPATLSARHRPFCGRSQQSARKRPPPNSQPNTTRPPQHRDKTRSLCSSDVCGAHVHATEAELVGSVPDVAVEPFVSGGRQKEGSPWPRRRRRFRRLPRRRPNRAGFDHSRESRWAELGSAIGVNDCACRTASVGQGHRQRVADKPEAADRPIL